MNVKVNVHAGSSDVSRALENTRAWGIKESVRVELTKFLKDLGNGKVNLGKQISDRTQVKYLQTLRSFLIYTNKPLGKISKKDTSGFDEKLSKDILKSEKNKPYSHEMKKGMRIAIRILLKWKFGEEKARSMTSFFDTRDKKKTPDYLKESEIDSLFKYCRTPRERYLIAVLFDSGARVEEFLNIRFEDIELPSGNKNFVQITFKEEYSKTHGRVISLYWKNSLEAVSEYLRVRKFDGIKEKDMIFDLSYDGIRSFLYRLGERVLQKRINPHLLRHSSATYYASKLNRQQLCYRYGWAFSSDMPDTYISRAGMLNKEVDEKVENTELGELKTKLSKEEFERKKLQEELNDLKSKREETSQEIKELREWLKKELLKSPLKSVVQQAQ